MKNVSLCVINIGYCICHQHGFCMCYQHRFLYVLSTYVSVFVINIGFFMCYQHRFLYVLSTYVSVFVINIGLCMCYQHRFLYVLSTLVSVCVINTGFCMCYQQVEVLTGAFMNRCISSLFRCCSSIPLPVTSTSVPGVYSP